MLPGVHTLHLQLKAGEGSCLPTRPVCPLPHALASACGAAAAGVAPGV